MENKRIKTVVTSSLAKIFPELDPKDTPLTYLSGLRNEPLSFQVAYKLDSEKDFCEGVYVKIDTALPTSLYSVGFVPVLQTRDPLLDDSFRPGLFGDILLPKKTNPRLKKSPYPWGEAFSLEDDAVRLVARTDSWQTLWLTVNENGKHLKSGSYPVRITFHSMKDDSVFGECGLVVDIIGTSLPKQNFKYTNWFHCDCLCDMYDVELFSERFWKIFADYVEKASRNGMNTILTPCFTPPLDTPVGDERMTVQLVGITLEDGKYSFDFSMLDRFIDIATKNGIEYFEHAHFFSQWGAKKTPKIMATVDGRYKRIFGWDTAAWGKKYKTFLESYIPALITYLKEKGLDKNFIYHVSDEPEPWAHADYLRAKRTLGNLLDGYTICDALSHYEFYEDGTVETPIVNIPHIKDFYGKAKDFWAYYTGHRCTGGFSNRKINTSSERNRMFGVQLYMHDIKGFLHWGYNYWYGVLSQGISNPCTDPGIFSGGGPGSSFIVYPAANGSCLQSIRQKVFYEALNDMRALKTLERLIGKRETRKFVTDNFGEITFDTHLGNADRILSFRKSVNEKIANSLKKQ